MTFEGYASTIANALLRGGENMGAGLGAGISGAAASIAEGLALKRKREQQLADDAAERQHTFDLLGTKNAYDIMADERDPRTNRLDRDAGLTKAHIQYEEEARATREAARAGFRNTRSDGQRALADAEAVIAELQARIEAKKKRPVNVPMAELTSELLNLPPRGMPASPGLSPFIAKPQYDPVLQGLGIQDRGR